MSKLTHNTLWARAATNASIPSRATSILSKSKSHQKHYASSSSPSRLQTSSSSAAAASASQGLPLTSAQQDALASIPGAVSGPYYGPQPAAFSELLDQPYYHDSPSTLQAVIVNNLANSLQNTIMLSAPMLRNVGSLSMQSHPSAPRPQRSLHLWTQSTNNAETTFGGRLSSPGQLGGRKRTIFDATSHPSSDLGAANVEGAEEAIASMMANLPEANKTESTIWLSEMTSLHAQYSGVDKSSTSGISLPVVDDVARQHHTEIGSSSPPSRTPSPKQQSSYRYIDKDSIHFGTVSEPPAKFAATTSAETSISSTISSGNNGSLSSQASTSSSIASTSSTAASTSSFSSSPPPSSKPHTSLNDHWARQFNVPRSTKRNDFMFEHGAYGIPKRHPLSSIRSSSANSSSNSQSKGKGKQSTSRSGPDPAAVPTMSKVQQAAGMLAAAADFLTGPQMSTSNAEHRPIKGEEALSVSFSGGSTADGHEVRDYSAYGSRHSKHSSSPRTDVQTTPSDTKESGNANKVVIRGEDGRIIKDRLRSVQVGEDAYFLRPDALGVADGVGGWTSRPGADPALFSRLLMHFCAVELSRYDNVSATDLASDNGNMLKAWAAVDPVEVMHRAWERCVRASRREGILGSSTALLALLRGDELRIANVGDCVLMIIRGGEMLFRSTEQQHSFNFPVQLGMMGDTAESMKKRTEAASKARAAGEGEVRSEHMENYDDVEDFPHRSASTDSTTKAKTFEETIDGQHRSNDNAVDDDEGPEWDEPRRDAGRWSIRVQADDIIVVGSDGLMDNLFDEDIIEEVLRFLPNGGQGDAADGQPLRSIDVHNFSPQLVSEALCSRAKAISEDSRAISSPFQQRAMEEGLHYVGGKHDDISVLVCLVGEREGIDSNAVRQTEGASQGAPTGKCFIH